MLFLFSEILLFVPLCQFDDLLAYFFQFTGFFGKFVEKRKRFLLPVNGMDGFYTLVVVVSYSSELLIEGGKLGVIFLCFFINFHYLELSTEDTGKDKFGLILHAGLLEHGDKLFVFLVIKTEVIAVRARVCQHLTPCGVTDSCFIFHNMKILKGSTWENLCPETPFGRDFQRLEIFSTAESTPRYMLTHIKIRLGRIIGLKDCLTFSAENELRSPGDKGREFFLSVHYGGSRQQPPINDFETADTSLMLFLKFICSRMAIRLSI